MPPPAIAKIEARLRAQGNGGTPPRSPAPEKVEKRVKKPKKGLEFSRFPAEIQQMIWAQAMRKPACHTFRFIKPKPTPANGLSQTSPWTIDLKAISRHQDPSAYRQWKSMLWNRNYTFPYKIENENEEEKKGKNKKGVAKKEVDKKGSKRDEPNLDEADLEKAVIEEANFQDHHKSITKKSQEAFSKLANVSFQAGFRNSMVRFQRIFLMAPNMYRFGAAIDVATDLVLIELERGEGAAASAWFEHSTSRMQIDAIRHRMRHFKRVAVHYKKSHSDALERGPFQCYCPAGSGLDCNQYKACPMEQACFLDCFPNLKEFYYVVEAINNKEKGWFATYKDHACRLDYKLKTSSDLNSAPFKLAHFFDTKKEYLQLCPDKFDEFLPQKVRGNPYVPFDAQLRPRGCLVKVMDIYKGRDGNETFKNPVEDRKKVKFGILLACGLEG